MTTTPPEGQNEPEVDKDDRSGFMVYDLTEKRFVGRKADSKSAATDSVTKRKGHKYETREV